ncbi:superoxide dismutase [Cu-Zn] SodC [Endozoicomonas sp.]|uniref:superoxide dismutase [Cu-Zn] SodC n=1 Tax=Endozoicomonas sp. TaxID=1892382 RepID=UPI002887E3F8|nr:superoxide dismutase [Cu-Zn] SodC [Endozoicomonas sp.]
MAKNNIRFLALPVLFSTLLSGCMDNKDPVNNQDSMAPVGKQLEVVMFQVTPQGNGPTVGKIVIHYADDNDASGGIRFQPALHDLLPGEHGFHVHENPSCEPGEKDGKKVAALAAGDHYDPEKTGHHEGPEGHGHLGDLPKLMVDEYGNAIIPVEASRLSLDDLKGHSLMIHAGADNYSDNPPLGGGGARIACGIVQ